MRNVESAVPSVLMIHSWGCWPVSCRRVMVVGTNAWISALPCCSLNAHASSNVILSPWKPWPLLSVGGDGLNTEPLRKYRPMSPAVYFTSRMSGRSAGLFSTSLTTCLKCATASVPRCAMYQPTRFGPMSMLRM